MSLRWRKNGRLVCAAKSRSRPGDTYIDDRLHYHLSLEVCAIEPDKNEAISGLWHWKLDEEPNDE